MAQIRLRIYVQPGRVEVFVNLKKKSAGYHILTAVVDTGAPVSLFPIEVMSLVDYLAGENGSKT